MISEYTWCHHCLWSYVTFQPPPGLLMPWCCKAPGNQQPCPGLIGTNGQWWHMMSWGQYFFMVMFRCCLFSLLNLCELGILSICCEFGSTLQLNIISGKGFMPEVCFVLNDVNKKIIQRAVYCLSLYHKLDMRSSWSTLWMWTECPEQHQQGVTIQHCFFLCPKVTQ